jgi:hypothetical protein
MGILLRLNRYDPAVQGGAGTLVAGRYLLSGAVGQGGMGRVWRGHDQLLDRVVAVKELILPPQSPAGHAELVARMLREARAAARLDHPGVVTIHDVVEHQGSPWIVMQFISGSSLRGEIDRNGRLPWQQVADLGAQVAEALAAAHGAGIIHRDLKPDNILLSGSRAFVTDFGIARIADATTQLTGTGVLVGTPAYMPPECLDGAAAGPAGDMWALGATLYAGVEGLPPFTGQTMSALITAVLTKAPARPRHAGPLLEVLAALLDKNPAQRPDAQTTARTLAACRSAQAVSESTGRFQPFPPVAQAALGPQHPETEVAAAAGPQAPGFRDTITGSRHSRGGRWDAFAAAGASQPARPVPGHPSFPSAPWPPAIQPAAPPHPQPPGHAPADRPLRRRWLATRPALAVAGVAVAAAVLGTFLALRNGGSQSPGTSAAAATTAGQRPKASAQAGSPSQSAKASARGASSQAATGPTATSLIATLTDPDGQGALSMAFAPDGTLAIADENGKIYLWNTTTRSLTTTLHPAAGVDSVAFGPDGTLAYSNGTTYLWNTAAETLVGTLTDPGGGLVNSVAFGSDGTLATVDANGNAYLWDTAARSTIATLPDPDGVPFQGASGSGGADPLSVAFGPDGNLAVAYNDGRTYLWDTATSRVIATLTNPQGAQTVAFGPGGILATASEDGNTYLWNTATSSLIAALTDPGSNGVSSSAFGPGNVLAVNDDNGHVYLWNTTTKSLTATLTDLSVAGAQSMAFAPDGTLATGSRNGTVYLWRISNSKS